MPFHRGLLTVIPSVNELKSQLPSIFDDLSRSIVQLPIHRHEESDAPFRRGLLDVIPSVNELKSRLPSILDDLSRSIGGAPAVTEAGLSICSTLSFIPERQVGKTRSLNERSMSYSHSHSQFLINSPLTTFIFPECVSYKEDSLRRNIRPTFHHLFILGWSVAENRHILGSPKCPYWGDGGDQFCWNDENGISEMCFINPYGASTAVQTDMVRICSKAATTMTITTSSPNTRHEKSNAPTTTASPTKVSTLSQQQQRQRQ